MEIGACREWATHAIPCPCSGEKKYIGLIHGQGKLVVAVVDGSNNDNKNNHNQVNADIWPKWCSA